MKFKQFNQLKHDQFLKNAPKRGSDIDATKSDLLEPKICGCGNEHYVDGQEKCADCVIAENKEIERINHLFISFSFNIDKVVEIIPQSWREPLANKLLGKGANQ